MKCYKCGENFDDNLKKCPFCSSDIKNFNEFELPELKKKEEKIHLEDNDENLTDNYFEIELKDKEEDEFFDKYDVDETIKESAEDIVNTKEFDLSLEKTKSISPVEDTRELENLSLLDDINMQIDKINDETKKEKDSRVETTSEEVEQIDNTELTSEESLKKRKQILLFTGIGSLLLAALIILFIVFKGVNNNVGKNYMTYLENSLNKYYDTLEYTEIINVLDYVKKDNKKLDEVQNKTKEYANKWVTEYIEMDIKTLGEFEEYSTKYKKMLNELHSNAAITYKNGIIKALTDSDYEELNNKIEKLYNDSSIYYVAMDYYNQNDYNRAFTTLERITNDNTYFDKANSYKDKIIANIIKLIEIDIAKIESDLDSSNDDNKLLLYSQIEEVLIEYNNVYSSVNLRSNNEYQVLLNEYHEKVLEYTDIVSGVNNQGTNNNPENNQDLTN